MVRDRLSDPIFENCVMCCVIVRSSNCLILCCLIIVMLLFSFLNMGCDDNLLTPSLSAPTVHTGELLLV